MKPTCRRICDQLTQYADGTLPSAERAEVQRHLEACPPCRVIASKECGARQLLRACADRLRAGQVPDTLRSRCQEVSQRSAASHFWSRRGGGSHHLYRHPPFHCHASIRCAPRCATHRRSRQVFCALWSGRGSHARRRAGAADASGAIRARRACSAIVGVRRPRAGQRAPLSVCGWPDSAPDVSGERSGHLAIRARGGVATTRGIYGFRPPYPHLVARRPHLCADYAGLGSAGRRRGPLRR
jgi:putative zinc finger protein